MDEPPELPKDFAARIRELRLIAAASGHSNISTALELAEQLTLTAVLNLRRRSEGRSDTGGKK